MNCNAKKQTSSSEVAKYYRRKWSDYDTITVTMFLHDFLHRGFFAQKQSVSSELYIFFLETF